MRFRFQGVVAQKAKCIRPSGGSMLVLGKQKPFEPTPVHLSVYISPHVAVSVNREP